MLRSSKCLMLSNILPSVPLLASMVREHGSHFNTLSSPFKFLHMNMFQGVLGCENQWIFEAAWRYKGRHAMQQREYTRQRPTIRKHSIYSSQVLMEWAHLSITLYAHIKKYSFSLCLHLAFDIQTIPHCECKWERHRCTPVAQWSELRSMPILEINSSIEPQWIMLKAQLKTELETATRAMRVSSCWPSVVQPSTKGTICTWIDIAVSAYTMSLFTVKFSFLYGKCCHLCLAIILFWVMNVHRC